VSFVIRCSIIWGDRRSWDKVRHAVVRLGVRCVRWVVSSEVGGSESISAGVHVDVVDLSRVSRGWGSHYCDVREFRAILKEMYTPWTRVQAYCLVPQSDVSDRLQSCTFIGYKSAPGRSAPRHFALVDQSHHSPSREPEPREPSEASERSLKASDRRNFIKSRTRFGKR
jgi:hypothetical protein